MSQTHCNLICHLVFSTKERRPFLAPDWGGVHRYLAGAVQVCVENQEAHHREFDFKREYIRLLNAYEIE